MIAITTNSSIRVNPGRRPRRAPRPETSLSTMITKASAKWGWRPDGQPGRDRDGTRSARRAGYGPGAGAKLTRANRSIGHRRKLVARMGMWRASLEVDGFYAA